MQRRLCPAPGLHGQDGDLTANPPQMIADVLAQDRLALLLGGVLPLQALLLDELLREGLATMRADGRGVVRKLVPEAAQFKDVHVVGDALVCEGARPRARTRLRIRPVPLTKVAPRAAASRDLVDGRGEGVCSVHGCEVAALHELHHQGVALVALVARVEIDLDIAADGQQLS